MRAHLIKRQTVEDHAAGHARSRSAFALWLTALRYADWHTPADVQRTFGAADLLGNGSNCVVFDIGGSNLSLEAQQRAGPHKRLRRAAYP